MGRTRTTLMRVTLALGLASTTRTSTLVCHTLVRPRSHWLIKQEELGQGQPREVLSGVSAGGASASDAGSLGHALRAWRIFLRLARKRARRMRRIPSALHPATTQNSGGNVRLFGMLGCVSVCLCACLPIPTADNG